MTRAILTAAACAALVPALAAAEVEGQYVTYTVGDTAFEGYAAHDPAQESRGTVLIVHDWDGMTAYEEERARMLAAEGYTAFAIDVYGADTDPQGVEEYRALSGALYGDREMFRERLMGSIMAAADIPGATEDMVIIGYCFGGAAVLEAARAGADLAGFRELSRRAADARGAGLVAGQRRAGAVLPRLGRPGLRYRRSGAGHGRTAGGRRAARRRDLWRRAAFIHCRRLE
jgi:hypothetical protein